MLRVSFARDINNSPFNTQTWIWFDDNEVSIANEYIFSYNSSTTGK